MNKLAPLLGFQWILTVSGAALTFALVWSITAVQKSPIPLSEFSGCAMVVCLLCTPVVGWVVDAHRRVIGLTAGNAGALSLGLILVAVLSWSNWYDADFIAIICVYSVRAVFAQLQSTAILALISEVKREDQRSQILMFWQTGGVVGTALGSLLSASLLQCVRLRDFAIADAIVTATALCFAVSNLRVESVSNQTVRGVSSNMSESGFGEIREVLAHDQTLRIVFLCAPLLNFIGAPIAKLLPTLVQIDWQEGAGTLAISEACLTVGMLTCAIWQTTRVFVLSAESTIKIGLFGLTIALFVVAGARGFGSFVLYTGMCCAGWAMMMINMPIQTLLALRVPANLRGRTESVLVLLSSCSSPFGLLVFSQLARSVGAREAFQVGGGLFGAVALYLARRLTSSSGSALTVSRASPVFDSNDTSERKPL